jgi:hypothetical protein
MSALALILGKKAFRSEIAQLKLDAAVNIQHDFGSTVTKNPIESKTGNEVDNFTDHVRLENPVLQIEGVIAEAPLDLLGSAFNVFTGAATSSLNKTIGGQLGGFASQALAAGLGSVAGLIANRNRDDIQFPQKAFEYLQELRRNKIPFTVVTRLKRYEDMILTRISVPQNTDDGNSLRFTATMEQIEIVQTQTVIIPEQTVTNQSAATKQALGKQTNITATDANASAAKSTLNDLGITTPRSGV